MVKPVADFTAQTGTTTGLSSRCKDCSRVSRQESVRRKFGISVEDYDTRSRV